MIQVPDFGDRFWVYQIVDQRTDAFAEIGKMYGSKPGFYPLAAADWKGNVHRIQRLCCQCRLAIRR